MRLQRLWRATLLLPLSLGFLTVTSRQHLTLRDAHAHTLEDMFDFDAAPSLDTPMVPAFPPAVDCTPK